MKNLFNFFAVLSICSAVSMTAKAQTNVNLEKLNHRTNKFSLKFIDDIELVPEGRGASSVDVANEKIETTPVEVIPEEVTEENSSSIEKCEAWQFKYAMMMNVEVEKLTNRKLYSFIDEWWATRYLYGGTTKRGIDCSAFTGTLINNVFGIKLPRTAREQYGVTQRIYKWDLQEGDLVFFNTRGGVSHVGVYLGNNYFVHSSVHDGVTISSLEDNYYHSKFISGGRFTYTFTVAPPDADNSEEQKQD